MVRRFTVTSSANAPHTIPTADISKPKAIESATAEEGA
jgi:hypothetical protein